MACALTFFAALMMFSPFRYDSDAGAPADLDGAVGHLHVLGLRVGGRVDRDGLDAETLAGGG